MEDFCNNSFNFSSTDYCNITNNSTNYHHDLVKYYIVMIIICTGLPLMLVAIVAVYFLVKKDHATPVYVINLLISDLIQLCCLTAWQAHVVHIVLPYFYYYGVMASVGFMVCISLERYMVIAWPLWYRFRRKIRTSLVVCVLVWTLPLVYSLPQYFKVNFQVRETVFAVYFLSPLPLFILFLVGTIRALSAAISVPADEKRRILAILVAVFLIYILMFLPSIIWSLIENAKRNRVFDRITFILLYCSPLADLIMYFFLRKGVIDKLLESLCCCKMSNIQQTDSTANENMTASCDEAV